MLKQLTQCKYKVFVCFIVITNALCRRVMVKAVCIVLFSVLISFVLPSIFARKENENK